MHNARKTAALKRAAQFLNSGMSKEEALNEVRTDTANYNEAEMVEVAGWVNHESFTAEWKAGDPTPTTIEAAGNTQGGAAATQGPGSQNTAATNGEFPPLDEVLKFNAAPIPQGETVENAMGFVTATMTSIDKLPDTAENLPLRQALIASVSKVNMWIFEQNKTATAANKVQAAAFGQMGTKQGPPAPMTLPTGNGDSLTQELFNEIRQMNYSDLTGKAFHRYAEIVGDNSYTVLDENSGKPVAVNSTLNKTQTYKFGLFKVNVIRKERFPGMKDTPMDFIGLKAKTTTPETTSRLTLINALELNAQILNSSGLAGQGKYYLIMQS